MRFSRISFFIFGALIASFASANAQQVVQAGVLRCQGGQNVGFLIGSSATLDCVFGGARRLERYTAVINRVGVDVGVTETTNLSWAVNAPTPRIGRGGLTGSYGGVGSNLSFGVGGGGNFLVGGPGNAYALQPISLQGQTGVNVAAGIVGLELRPGGVSRRYARRRG